MPDPRIEDHRDGPERSTSYGYQFGDIHDSVVNDERRDPTFYNGISNAGKTAYICEALGMKRAYFNLDLPLPFEDWAKSDDASKSQAGMYMATMRVDFYEKLFAHEPDLKQGEAWALHAQAEYWNNAFNRIIHRRQGLLVGEGRRLH